MVVWLDMRHVFFSGPGEPQPSANYVIPAPLTAEELRVLGCLIEKSFLTPDVYPLTLNSVVTACNQKTSRDPVVAYDDVTVDAILTMLQGRGLAARISGADHRVPKYKELLSDKAGLRVSETAILCVLMLRGPQTVNEIKERTNRIHEFADIEEVESTLERLMQREVQPLAVRLPKQAGHKELRYMHLLGDAAQLEERAAAPRTTAEVPSRDRLSRLEEEVASLKQHLEHFEQLFAEFRKQFD